MNKRTSAPARIISVTALVIAFVVALIVIGGSLGDGDSGDSSGSGRAAKQSQSSKRAEKVPATYEVKSGDTLSSIALRMGISVAQIERLNPGVDPQILVAGQQLKLR